MRSIACSMLPTFLQRPYSVPEGIPNSAAAFCTGIPFRMASSEHSRSSWAWAERRSQSAGAFK